MQQPTTHLLLTFRWRQDNQIMVNLVIACRDTQVSALISWYPGRFMNSLKDSSEATGLDCLSDPPPPMHQQTNKQNKHRETDRQTDRHTDRQTDRPTDRQTDRQTDRPTDSESKETRTKAHTHTETDTRVRMHQESPPGDRRPFADIAPRHERCLRHLLNHGADMGRRV